MSVEIRPLQKSDEAEWRRLWAGYLAFYETTVAEEVYRTTFARLISGAGNEYRGFIACLEAKPVGLAHYLFHRHNWSIEDVCYLQDLYADPQVRGKGVGRALIEAVHGEAIKAGAHSVYWMTNKDNTTARQLYDRIAKVTPFIKYVKAV
ncbi:GNAT family N-acetyltransferase [Phyllobacterium endophyticum]|uniref:GNAT family N-acetyltransferase n=1 Tax=Phyllobacterium endophyticum TaxID=1149773 RepID=A0A2P7ALQ7_9HYPH|nr:GNAT family N-acetyltransferase [Phyllobacterium endophyticum]MBB3236300.1 GNAT superfamily N-acetyltransferase [Phyllobacterium endophyticum]PSH55151.1 GNAT family N-acetyltransferase [Phyllobacterium endophyticum]TYR39845.1 GNAT family N-acetyltransferase [Phyllobacterium endophyticum]